MLCIPSQRSHSTSQIFINSALQPISVRWAESLFPFYREGKWVTHTVSQWEKQEQEYRNCYTRWGWSIKGLILHSLKSTAKLQLTVMLQNKGPSPVSWEWPAPCTSETDVRKLLNGLLWNNLLLWAASSSSPSVHDICHSYRAQCISAPFWSPRMHPPEIGPPAFKSLRVAFHSPPTLRLGTASQVCQLLITLQVQLSSGTCDSSLWDSAPNDI